MSEQAGTALGVDIGGTKTAVAVVDEAGGVLERVVAPTPSKDPDELVRVVADLAEPLRQQHAPVALGVGAAGLVDAAGENVLAATHLTWDHEPLKARLEEATGLPVHLANDGDAAAWAEHRFGAGQGTDPMLLVAVGTGVGGGFVVDGRLHRGWTGAAFEVGHVVLVRDGRPCGCGARGCLEQYASGSALEREARAMAADHPGAAHTLLGLAGGDPHAIRGTMVTEAARAGDAVAQRVLTKVGEALGLGLVTLVNVLDPQRVVIGGGVSEAGDLLLDPARAVLADNVIGRKHRPLPEVVPAVLGNGAGVVGAADLARVALRR